MSKRKTRRQSKRQLPNLSPPRRRRRALLAVGLLLSLLAGTATLAAWSGLWAAQKKKPGGVVSTNGFSAASPAKELVYSANGTLLASEEPSNSGGAPPAPTVLTAAPGNMLVTLNWNAVSGATYNVKRSTTSGSGYTTIASLVNGTTYTNSPLANGTTYYFVVSAVVNSVEGRDSNEASATPSSGVSPPPAPTGLVAAAGNGVVSLSWTAAAGAASYTVKRSTTSGGPYGNVSGGSGLTATSFSDSTVTNGTTYYYVVFGTNSAGDGPNSGQASATPMAPPAAPTNLIATAGNASVALSWTASSGAASYNVKRSTTSGGPYGNVATGVTATGYTDSPLTNGTTYFYVVTAQNVGGESGNSNQASATPTGGGGGGSPCNSVTVTPTSVTAPHSGGPGSFTISNLSPSGCSWTLVSSASWLTITSPTSGSGNATVNYTVAVNGTGTGRNASITVQGGGVGLATHKVNQSP